MQTLTGTVFIGVISQLKSQSPCRSASYYYRQYTYFVLLFRRRAFSDVLLALHANSLFLVKLLSGSEGYHRNSNSQAMSSSFLSFYHETGCVVRGLTHWQFQVVILLLSRRSAWSSASGAIITIAIIITSRIIFAIVVGIAFHIFLLIHDRQLIIRSIRDLRTAGTPCHLPPSPLACFELLVENMVS